MEPEFLLLVILELKFKQTIQSSQKTIDFNNRRISRDREKAKTVAHHIVFTFMFYV